MFYARTSTAPASHYEWIGRRKFRIAYIIFTTLLMLCAFVAVIFGIILIIYANKLDELVCNEVHCSVTSLTFFAILMILKGCLHITNLTFAWWIHIKYTIFRFLLLLMTIFAIILLIQSAYVTITCDKATKDTSRTMRLRMIEARDQSNPFDGHNFSPLENAFKCCGIFGKDDYAFFGKPVPKSCCKKLKKHVGPRKDEREDDYETEQEGGEDIREGKIYKLRKNMKTKIKSNLKTQRSHNKGNIQNARPINHLSDIIENEEETDYADLTDIEYYGPENKLKSYDKYSKRSSNEDTRSCNMKEGKGIHLKKSKCKDFAHANTNKSNLKMDPGKTKEQRYEREVGPNISPTSMELEKNFAQNNNSYLGFDRGNIGQYTLQIVNSTSTPIDKVFSTAFENKEQSSSRHRSEMPEIPFKATTHVQNITSKINVPSNAVSHSTENFDAENFSTNYQQNNSSDLHIPTLENHSIKKSNKTNFEKNVTANIQNGKFRRKRSITDHEEKSNKVINNRSSNVKLNKRGSNNDVGEEPLSNQNRNNQIDTLFNVSNIFKCACHTNSINCSIDKYLSLKKDVANRRNQNKISNLNEVLVTDFDARKLPTHIIHCSHELHNEHANINYNENENIENGEFNSGISMAPNTEALTEKPDAGEKSDKKTKNRKKSKPKSNINAYANSSFDLRIIYPNYDLDEVDKCEKMIESSIDSINHLDQILRSYDQQNENPDIEIEVNGLSKTSKGQPSNILLEEHFKEPSCPIKCQKISDITFDFVTGFLNTYLYPYIVDISKIYTSNTEENLKKRKRRDTKRYKHADQIKATEDGHESQVDGHESQVNRQRSIHGITVPTTVSNNLYERHRVKKEDARDKFISLTTESIAYPYDQTVEKIAIDPNSYVYKNDTMIEEQIVFGPYLKEHYIDKDIRKQRQFQIKHLKYLQANENLEYDDYFDNMYNMTHKQMQLEEGRDDEDDYEDIDDSEMQTSEAYSPCLEYKERGCLDAVNDQVKAFLLVLTVCFLLMALICVILFIMIITMLRFSIRLAYWVHVEQMVRLHEDKTGLHSRDRKPVPFLLKIFYRQYTGTHFLKN